MYLCLAALSIGIFASCKAKKGVEATFSDLDGSWNIVELNGKPRRIKSSSSTWLAIPFPEELDAIG